MKKGTKWILALVIGASLTAGGITGVYASHAKGNPGFHRQMDGEQRQMGNGFHKGDCMGFEGRQQNHQEMLALLNIDEQTFRQEVESGKSLAEIAAQHNVSRQAVVDLMVKHMTERIDQRLADGKITKEQADTMKADVRERAEKMVDRKPMGMGPKMRRGK